MADSKFTITEAQYKAASLKLLCSPATLQAVAQVESNGNGWIDDTHVQILFEGHIFWSELKAAGINPYNYSKKNYDILYPKWTKKYYKGGIAEYTRLERAEKISKAAADKSASWGMFQILGKNYAKCGCKTVDEFVAKMKESSAAQLDLFVNFIKSEKLQVYLQKQQWASFAYKYNGSAYKKNGYDTKLKKAFLKLKSYGMGRQYSASYNDIVNNLNQ